MRRRIILRRILSPAAALALCLAAGAPARADVTIEEKTTFDGFGERGWGASEGTSTLIISGDKARQESTTNPTGAVMKKFAGPEGMKSATITRLDRGSLITVDYHGHSYYEMTFEQMKQNMDAALAAMSGPGSAPEAQVSTQEPPVKWSPLTFDVKKTGETQSVNGFPCEHVVITGTTTGENTQTKQTCKMIFTVDLWQTQKTAVLDEVMAFQRKQAEAMGFDPAQMKAMASALRSLFGSSTEGLQTLTTEMRKIQGYPIKSRMTIESGGTCGQETGLGEGGGKASFADAMKGMGGPFKGMFGRKKTGGEEQAAATPTPAGSKESAATPALKKVFGSSTEVVSIATGPAPSGAFEPPADFKKKEPPQMAGGRKP